MSTNPPLRIASGDASTVIDVARGGRLASLRVGEHELLVGPPDATDAGIRWGCFLMAPWPGRLAGGRFRFMGHEHQLRRTHGRHAIHGLGWSAPWTVTSASTSEAELEVELEPLGWPFGGRVRQRVAIEPDRLRLEAAIDADEPMPAALGWHPWFDRRGADPRVTVRGDRVLATQGLIPTGAIDRVAGRTDLRAGPHLGSRRLDHAYLDVGSPAVISWPDIRLSLEFGPDLSTVVVHTPRGGVCIEPETAWPNALAAAPSGPRTLAEAGVARLAAGARLSARLDLRWELPSPADP